MATVSSSRAAGGVRVTRRGSPPLEHRVLLTATLILIAFGAVMVYSASSPLGVVNGDGLGTGEFVMYMLAAGIGLGAMRVTERYGLRLLTPQVVKVLLGGSFVLLLAVLVPHVGVSVGGARRWLGAGPIQFQPSELMKLALILYVARYVADNPRRLQRGIKPALAPVAVIVGPACLLIYVEPDLGTAMVVSMTVATMLYVGGVPTRYLATVAGIAACGIIMLSLGSSYQRARLTSFLHPSSCARTTCFQSRQGEISVGSGGLFGVGLGKGIEKDFYLPEAQTDFILAVIGEELGVAGIAAVVVLYGMIAYAGLRTARKAPTRHSKLVATGLTSLILCQGLLNIFVVLGIAPLTGVPLPFISYAPSSLCVLLASVGLLLNIARPSARELRAVDRDAATDRDRGRRDSRARHPGDRGRRRAAG